MEVHLEHINSKYVDSEGNLNNAYASNADGLAVIGFMFKIKKTKVNAVHKFYRERRVNICYFLIPYIQLVFNKS